MDFTRKVRAEIFQFFFQIVKWERQFSVLTQLSFIKNSTQTEVTKINNIHIVLNYLLLDVS